MLNMQNGDTLVLYIFLFFEKSADFKRNFAENTLRYHEFILILQQSCDKIPNNR